MLALFTAIPAIGTIVTAITTALFNAKVSLFQARTGVTRDVAVATIQGAVVDYQTRAHMLETIAASKILTWLIVAFAVPIVMFNAKCIVWDDMLGWGSTPELHGQVADYMGLIINWLFGGSATLVAGQTALKVVDKMKG